MRRQDGCRQVTWRKQRSHMILYVSVHKPSWSLLVRQQLTLIFWIFSQHKLGQRGNAQQSPVDFSWNHFWKDCCWRSAKLLEWGCGDYPSAHISALSPAWNLYCIKKKKNCSRVCGIKLWYKEFIQQLLLCQASSLISQIGQLFPVLH